MSLNTSFRRATSGTGPSTTLSRTILKSSPTSSTSTPSTYICNQCRHASLLRRPKRPYTFTQLVALSDGSTFIHRTTSPTPVYRSTRDTRNSLLWNPTSKKLLTVEDDEAGRLAAFRAKFGRSFDLASTAAEEVAAAVGPTAAQKQTSQKSDLEQKQEAEKMDAAAEKALAQEEADLQEEEDNLLDLISSFGQQQDNTGKKK
ncbi:50S ribosomal protein L36, putative [Talaromyces stipitatus ATCC 10500]|uniref:50S ribosomal protein L36, putative n=1 Tax=Talaromyces stipitatus (strain ATCC 10500 / CBS 375.48 / QM 6759 / NRRL 1006) TaxID=441959 RepID=B8LXL8_TALSN|nr:mitochondrial 54S ribosomal protein YmL36 [Talaromyces stipitatus ATCC 10500]EED24518.1 50S ribosomal protein L36, putative [Talaromyces stipitatus ATCC 10500]